MMMMMMMIMRSPSATREYLIGQNVERQKFQRITSLRTIDVYVDS
jgi:hypothetical protein